MNLDWLTSWIYEDASGTFCKAPRFLAQLYYQLDVGKRVGTGHEE